MKHGKTFKARKTQKTRKALRRDPYARELRQAAYWPRIVEDKRRKAEKADKRAFADLG